MSNTNTNTKIIAIYYQGNRRGHFRVDEHPGWTYAMGRVELENDVRYGSEEDIALTLAMHLPYYQSLIQSGKPCLLHDLWGWGLPYRQMMLSATRFVTIWHTLTPETFRDRVVDEFVMSKTPPETIYIDRYGTMMKAMMRVLYELKESIEYREVEETR